LKDARPFDDVLDVIRHAHHNDHKVFIISHKTRFARRDTVQAWDMQEMALRWLKVQGFFSVSVGLGPQDVFFKGTRSEKVKTVEALKCDLFIDDLIETFQDESFPSHVQKLLFTGQANVNQPMMHSDVNTLTSWKKAYDLFNDAHRTIGF
jgi:uncharacterized HAD superfamily protein